MSDDREQQGGPAQAAPGYGPRYRPRLGVAELIVHLWRAKWLMLLVFLPIFAAGVYFAYQLPTKYVASSRLLVSLGEEYVFRPRVGDEAAGAFPESEELIQTEIELLQSPVVAEQVMERFGLERLYPDIAEELRAAPADEQYELAEQGLLALQDDFSASAAPRRRVILTQFAHEDPALSAEVLNALLGAYIRYRAEIFATRSPTSFGEQREVFETRLLEVEEEIQTFLSDNGIGDFEAERVAVQGLYATIQEATFENQTRLSQISGQLRVLGQQLDSMEPLVDIFIEDSTEQTLVQLELEREQLLARYTETSQPVQAIDKRIERARQYISGQDGAVGTVRRGPNPVYQDIETSYSTLRSEAAAARQRRAELQRQSEAVAARQKTIIALEPRWQELQRERALVEENVRSFATRELEARTLTEIAQEDADNIRILEPARIPAQGTSLKLPVALLAFLIAAITALFAGVLWALTRQGFATARSLERTTGLPVVSTVRRHS